MRNLHLKEGLYLFYKERLFQSICDEDKLILDFFEHKHNGYAIDMGAADGVCVNNCIILYVLPEFFAELLNNENHKGGKDLLFGSGG
jgi:hypothetical protein